MDALRAWLAATPWARLGLQAVAGAVLVAALAGGGWTWYRAREARGAAALGEAMALAQRAESAPGSAEARDRAVAALERVLGEHPGLTTVPQAAYELGNLRYAARQYPAARGAYEISLAKGASGTIKTLAAAGIGYTWEAEKNYTSAVQAYEVALRGLGPSDFLYEDTLLSLARAQELAGKPTAALELYERALKDVPDSRRADDLRARIADLKSRAKP